MPRLPAEQMQQNGSPKPSAAQQPEKLPFIPVSAISERSVTELRCGFNGSLQPQDKATFESMPFSDRSLGH
jgi:hypothetical protein